MQTKYFWPWKLSFNFLISLLSYRNTSCHNFTSAIISTWFDSIGSRCFRSFDLFFSSPVFAPRGLLFPQALRSLSRPFCKLKQLCLAGHYLPSLRPNKEDLSFIKITFHCLSLIEWSFHKWRSRDLGVRIFKFPGKPFGGCLSSPLDTLTRFYKCCVLIAIRRSSRSRMLDR